jgi:hypothetical protein
MASDHPLASYTQLKKRLMGFEPTTFCMATVVGIRSWGPVIPL